MLSLVLAWMLIDGISVGVGIDDGLSLLNTDRYCLLVAGTQAIIEMPDHQYQWLAVVNTGGYDLEIRHFQKWLA